MKNVFSLIAITLTLVGCAATAEAQQAKKVPRIGYLIPGSRSFAPAYSTVKAFLQGLHELGYIEGKNIAIEYRYAEGKPNRYPELASELVRLKVDVIFTSSDPAVQAAKKASKTIPIVFAAVSDPVAAGLVDSLARPGGNATGLSTLSPELDGKRLELFKETFPKATRVAFLRSPSPRWDIPFREAEAVARTLGLQLQSLEVKGPEDFKSAFETAKSGGAQGLTAPPNPIFGLHLAMIAELAAKNRLPAIYSDARYPETGGLMSYGPNYDDLWRRAATYVDKILKGAKPADLPVEQPTKFELVINLKAAKQIGVTIPPNVLARADKVIK